MPKSVLEKIVLSLFLNVNFFNCFKTSIYTKTTVIEEKCFDIPFKEINNVQSDMQCITSCSNDVSCKRSLYCGTSASSPNTCLFYSDGKDCFVKQGTDCRCYMKEYSNCESGVCECPIGKYGVLCQDTVKDCADRSVIDLTSVGKVISFIKPASYPVTFEVLCDFVKSQTYIQTQSKYCTQVNFNRTYEDYVKGFGNIRAEYWLGLEKIAAILDNRPNMQIRAGITPISTTYKAAYYTNFRLGPADQGYTFHAQFVSGTAGNALTATLDVNGRPFSTFDNDSTGIYNCPGTSGAGWWYVEDPGCTEGNLNAPQNYWKSYPELKTCNMYIRM